LGRRNTSTLHIIHSLLGIRVLLADERAVNISHTAEKKEGKMRINSRVFTEKTDLLESIQITNCPVQFRKIAEQLVMMATKPGYSVGSYNTMTELDKMLMWDYWREFDGMKPTLNCSTITGIREWFIHEATAPELIRRARQWLSEHQYFLIDESVAQRAHEAGTKFSKAIKQ